MVVEMHLGLFIRRQNLVQSGYSVAWENPTHLANRRDEIQEVKEMLMHVRTNDSNSYTAAPFLLRVESFNSAVSSLVCQELKAKYLNSDTLL